MNFVGLEGPGAETNPEPAKTGASEIMNSVQD
jgi:hypothetical protein